MSSGRATIYVIDDDTQIRKAIGQLCEEAGYQVRLFATTDDFLAEGPTLEPCCLVLDVRFPGASPNGLALQRMLATSGNPPPIVFISGHADIRVAVDAMKSGAVEFLPKPFREQELLDAIRIGIERDRRRMEYDAAAQEAIRRVETLTSREREIMSLIAEGLLSKQIADRLQVSEVTAKVHRARMMKKLQLRSPVQVARLADEVRRYEETRRHSTNEYGITRIPADLTKRSNPPGLT